MSSRSSNLTFGMNFPFAKKKKQQKTQQSRCGECEINQK